MDLLRHPLWSASQRICTGEAADDPAETNFTFGTGASLASTSRRREHATPKRGADTFFSICLICSHRVTSGISFSESMPRGGNQCSAEIKFTSGAEPLQVRVVGNGSLAPSGTRMRIGVSLFVVPNCICLSMQIPTRTIPYLLTVGVVFPPHGEAATGMHKSGVCHAHR